MDDLSKNRSIPLQQSRKSLGDGQKGKVLPRQDSTKEVLDITPFKQAKLHGPLTPAAGLDPVLKSNPYIGDDDDIILGIQKFEINVHHNFETSLQLTICFMVDNLFKISTNVSSSTSYILVLTRCFLKVNILIKLKRTKRAEKTNGGQRRGRRRKDLEMITDYKIRELGVLYLS